MFRHDEHLFDGPPGSAFDKLSHALVVLNGERHRRQRGLLQPAFAKSAMEGYATDIVTETDRGLLDGREKATSMPQRCVTTSCLGSR